MGQIIPNLLISRDRVGYAAAANNPEISVAFNDKSLFLAHSTFPL